MSKVKFNKKNHTYTLIDDNGNKSNLVSVTTLLKRHGLSPDYSAVSDDVLKAKAERGSIIHEELERFVNYGEVGFTSEVENFLEVCRKQKIKPKKSEFMVWNDEVAGTVDVTGTIDGKTFIGDFKTTASLHKEAVAWQLSLYAYLMGKQFDKMLCIHFPNENACNVVEIKPIPREEIEKLLECERNCELYQKKELKLADDVTEQIVSVQKKLKSLNELKKQLEEEENEFKDYLIEKMEETGAFSINNDYFKITYIAPTTRNTIDTARLKKEMPDIAEDFNKVTAVKASVRITLKENSDGDYFTQAE